MKTAINKKRLNKLDIILITILFVLALLTTLTVAYFTDSDKVSDTIEFGTISVNASSNELASFSASRSTGNLMPGDTIKVEFDLENTGEDAYYLTLISVASSTEVTGFNDVIGLYAGSIATSSNKLVNSLSDITISTTKTVGTILAGAKETQTKTITLSLQDTTNNLADRSLAVFVDVFAIQKDNVEEAHETLTAEEYAFDLLLDYINANYGVVGDGEAVIINGIIYYYNATTNSFAVGYGNTISGNALADETLTNVDILSNIRGKKVTELKKNAFSYTNVQKVFFGDNIEIIGDYAFYSCKSLSSITIPNGVQEIGRYAFCYCTSLTSIIIPDSVKSIGDGAFDSCKSLSSITIPNGVQSIGNSAFSECRSLKIVYFETDVETIGVNALPGGSIKIIYIKQGVTLADGSGLKTYLSDNSWSTTGETETYNDTVYVKYTKS